MKGILCERYGPPEVLVLRKVDQPKPKKNQLLVRIHAAAVTSGDCRIRAFRVPVQLWLPSRIVLGITRPRRKILGLWFSGVVEEVDDNVKKFRVGDEVWARTKDLEFGAYAEYIAISEDVAFISKKPTNATFEDAAAIPFGALTALYFLQKGGTAPNSKVLVFGASGSVGTAAVQIAKNLQAYVTAVTSTSHVQRLGELGADAVIDYMKEDYWRSAEKYDLIFDAVGRTSHRVAKEVLRSDGAYMSVMSSGHADPRPADLDSIRDMVESGRYDSVIDRCYDMEDMVAAQNYVETGHKFGNVVVRM
jgi:NADPH:quinone reductase-like Zn-dependent oxidoreductase